MSDPTTTLYRFFVKNKTFCLHNLSLAIVCLCLCLCFFSYEIIPEEEAYEIIIIDDNLIVQYLQKTLWKLFKIDSVQ